MHTSIIEWFLNLPGDGFRGARILEVGSGYVNGSIRPIIEKYGPAEYIGVDVSPGLFVDRVISPNDSLLDHFSHDAFDVVISAETLEHVEEWSEMVTSMKAVLKPRGEIIITTRSEGFPWHGYPFDHWRYSLIDMTRIFADFEILDLKADPFKPGVFLIAKKPESWNPEPLENIKLNQMRRPCWARMFARKLILRVIG